MGNRPIIFSFCVILTIAIGNNIIELTSSVLPFQIPIQWPITANETGNKSSIHAGSIKEQ
ncbi:MAG TPA: hypothetical protein VI146_00155 [Nitrososphaeraceae archaeon]